MESNSSLCEGEHLTRVTKNQIEEFVELQGKSVVLLEELKGFERTERKKERQIRCSTRGLIQDLWSLLKTTVQKIFKKN